MVQLNSESMFSANKSSLLFAQNAGSDDPKVQLQAVQTDLNLGIFAPKQTQNISPCSGHFNLKFEENRAALAHFTKAKAKILQAWE